MKNKIIVTIDNDILFSKLQYIANTLKMSVGQVVTQAIIQPPFEKTIEELFDYVVNMEKLQK